jgi:hypothetical protein
MVSDAEDRCRNTPERANGINLRGADLMRHSDNNPRRALLLKRFYDIWEERPNRVMPNPGSPDYFELAIELIMRDIAVTEIQARRQSRLIRPLHALKLRKLRRRLTILLEMAKAQLALSQLRDRPIGEDR